MRTGHAPETKQNVTLLKSNIHYMSKGSQLLKMYKVCHLLHHSLTCHLQSCCQNPEASSMCLWELTAYDAPAQNKDRDQGASKLIAKGNDSTLWLMCCVAARKPILICIQ